MFRPKPIPPKPGQESVWDYPRPPRLEPVTKTLKVIFNDVVIAETNEGYRVLETSHPPMYYFPPHSVRSPYLQPVPQRQSFCEWKGLCHYFHVQVNDRQAPAAVWSYPDPTPSFTAIAHYLSFYASKMDACYVGDELVQAQAGDFYGGWITKDIVGPFKGEAGTRWW